MTLQQKPLTRLVLALVITQATGTSASAAPPSDLSDLVGARGSSGETQLQARGYVFVRATRVRDQSWTFWWSDLQKQCVTIATTDGRYASIDGIPEQNCRPGAVPGDAPPKAPAENVLTLVCYGTGQHATYTPHFGYQWNNDAKKYEPMQRMESGNEQFNSGVQVDIRNGEGRIHLAGKMIPPLNSGGTDGWWPLEDLQMGDDRIAARYKVNVLSRPTVEIDRRSGLINVKGSPGFSGKCDVGDWGASRKF